MNGRQKYLAFISYKREDEKWAKWLQHKLEHYKLPTSTRKVNPLLPERVKPIFKDTTDLAGGVLEKAIREALDSSKYLIVICSPRAVLSPWVSKEVQEFIDSGREENIIPFIVSGEPNAKETAKECFPQNLRELSGSRELLGININEMGREAAAIKVVARMFGLQFDTLWQRWERELRKRRLWILSLSVLVAIIGFTIAGIMFYQHRKMQINQARAVANRAQQLVEQGNSYLAQKLLLEVLPDERDLFKRPYTAEAEAALRYANKHNSGIFFGHDGIVTDVAFSPDGKYITSVAGDNEVRLWETESGKCLKTFKTDTLKNSIQCISPNGKYVVTFEGYFPTKPEDEEIMVPAAFHLWDVESGERIKTFSGHENWIDSIDFSSDGKYIVTASRDKTIRVWDIYAGTCIRIIRETWKVKIRRVIFFGTGIGGEMVELGYSMDRKVAISSDGRYIASPSYDKEGNIRVWSLADQGRERKIKGVKGDVDLISLSPTGKYLLTSAGYDDNYILRLWDVESETCIRCFEGHLEQVTAVTFSPNEKYLVSASDDKSIRLWDVESGACVRCLEVHANRVNGVAFSQDGRFIVSGSGDKAVRLWEIEPNEFARTINAEGASFDVAISPNGTYIASELLNAEVDGIVGSDSWMKMIRKIKSEIRLWEVESGKFVRVFSGHTDWCYSASFSPDEKYLVTASDDKTIRLWEVESGECLRIYEGHSDAVDYALFSPDGKYIASISNDKTIRLWDVDSDRCLRVFDGNSEEIESIDFSPDGKYLLSTPYEGPIYLWEVESDECAKVLEGHEDHINKVCFSSDSRYVFTASFDRTIRLWELATGDCIRVFEGHDGSVNDIAFTLDEKYIVSASHDKTIRFWEVATGKCIQVLNGHNDIVWDVDFCPDDEYIVSASRDNTFRLWQVKSGRCVYVCDQKTFVHSAQFIMNGQYIVSAPHDMGMRFWRFYPLQELMELTRDRFKNSPLTDKERQEYYLE